MLEDTLLSNHRLEQFVFRGQTVIESVRQLLHAFPSSHILDQLPGIGSGWFLIYRLVNIIFGIAIHPAAIRRRFRM